MIRWGIIGAGHIAKVFCNALRFSKTGQLCAIASETAGKAAQLAKQFECPRSYDSYGRLFDDADVDAVYIATIHPFHLQPVLAAVSAGKHVLVEKPIATNLADAKQMIDAARSADVFLMEGYMYRCHPQMERLKQLIQEGAIGDVLFVRSEFGYHAPFDPDIRNFDRNLGGGGILDVGGYPVSMCRMIAGAASKRNFLNPVELKATGQVGPSGVDHYTSAVMKFENGVVGQIATGVGCHIPASTVIHGSRGILEVIEPWLPSSPCRHATDPLSPDTEFASSELLLTSDDGEANRIVVSADRDLFAYEADSVVQHIQQRQSPAMSWDDSLGNMEVLDNWLNELGIDFTS